MPEGGQFRIPQNKYRFGASGPAHRDQTSSHHFYPVSQSFSARVQSFNSPDKRKKKTLPSSCTAAITPPKLSTPNTLKRQSVKHTALEQILNWLWEHGGGNICVFWAVVYIPSPTHSYPAVDIFQGHDWGDCRWESQGLGKVWWSVSHVMVHKARTMQRAGGSVAQGQGGHRYQGNWS